MNTKQFAALQWTNYDNNPIISPPFPSPIIADPTYITPKISKDRKWHLFAHSLLGIHHYISNDGIHFDRLPHIAVKHAMRPYIYYEDGIFYLYYEKIKPYILWYSWLKHRWISHIEMRFSEDCFIWSQPVTIFKASLPWHYNELGESISNPCLVKYNNTYYLYYSAALTYIQDCGFNEPLYIGLAISKSPYGPFESLEQPILQPSRFYRWCNIGCGSFKVIELEDGFIGLQNGIYWDYTINHSGSAILLHVSNDGIHFSMLQKDPILKPDNCISSYKRSHVYAFDAKQINNSTWHLYFNARNNWYWTKGKEHIGLLIGKTKSH